MRLRFSGCASSRQDAPERHGGTAVRGRKNGSKVEGARLFFRVTGRGESRLSEREERRARVFCFHLSKEKPATASSACVPRRIAPLWAMLEAYTGLRRRWKVPTGADDAGAVGPHAGPNDARAHSVGQLRPFTEGGPWHAPSRAATHVRVHATHSVHMGACRSARIRLQWDGRARPN